MALQEAVNSLVRWAHQFATSEWGSIVIVGLLLALFVEAYDHGINAQATLPVRAPVRVWQPGLATIIEDGPVVRTRSSIFKGQQLQRLKRGEGSRSSLWQSPRCVSQ